MNSTIVMGANWGCSDRISYFFELQKKIDEDAFYSSEMQESHERF